MPKKKEIIYPIFLECYTYTKNPYWANVFENLAYGNTPYGTYFSKDFFCCGYKNKEFSYLIKDKEAKKIHDDLYLLLTEKLELFSNEERSEKRRKFFEMEKRIQKDKNDWNNLKKKRVKNILFERYVLAKKKEHNLSNSQAKYLLAMIFIFIVFKLIKPSDIVYTNSKIQEIKGITIKNGKIDLGRKIVWKDAKYAKIPIPTDKILSENWYKYIEKLKKEIS